MNGDVDAAIELQEKAIAKGGRSEEYRRRLRTYEAAKQAFAAKKTESAPVKKKALSLHDDD